MTRGSRTQVWTGRITEIDERRGLFTAEMSRDGAAIPLRYDVDFRLADLRRLCPPELGDFVKLFLPGDRDPGKILLAQLELPRWTAAELAGARSRALALAARLRDLVD